MSKLDAFLNPVQMEETREVVISKRFVGEDGKPKPFIIRALTQEEADTITNQSRKLRKVNGHMQEFLDATEFNRRMVAAATVEPDFSAKVMCDGYGTSDPLEVPGKMLLSGEFSRLLVAITDLSGFNAGGAEEDAKNF